MSQFQDLWDWMGALQTSLPFAIALPIILATVFATFADWFDHFLATYRQTPSQCHADEPNMSARQREGRGATPSRSPALKAGGAHNAERY
jgi:hypothetical protein